MDFSLDRDATVFALISVAVGLVLLVAAMGLFSRNHMPVEGKVSRARFTAWLDAGKNCACAWGPN
jgi:hypothetical protein